MLEAIFKLLKLEMQVAVAVVTLVSGVALWLLRPLVRRMWNALERSKAQPVPERQDPEVPVAPAQARSQEVVSVAAPSPEPAPERSAAKPSLRQVLAVPDDALYVTSNSELVIAHPRSEELLEMVDRIGVAALHKDGSPFIEVSPDITAPYGRAEHLANEGDPVFIDSEPARILPLADGKLWVRLLCTFERLN